MDQATLDLLRAEIDALMARARAHEEEICRLEANQRAAARRSRRRLVAATIAAGLGVAWSAAPEARAQFGLTLAGLNARLLAVEAKTAPLSLDGTTLTVGGVNVQIVDGTGSTKSNSGLGNLTVGYNVSRSIFGGSDTRTGSHNLIVGDLNNFTSYGGLVAGQFNQIDGIYATACGYQNTASGDHASVCGGFQNTASGDRATVCGGEVNTASGASATVSGGSNNIASGTGSSVSGGEDNAASGVFATVSGGFARSATNFTSWAAGGLSQPQ